MNKLIAVVILFASCFSCVEPFSVQSLDFEKAVVVEGRFTNEQKAHYVKLSYTRPVGEETRSPITGANVWVEDSNGNRFDFMEKEPGHYESSPDLAGIAGNSYQLFFTTDAEKQYKSEAQILLASPPIDSIYNEYAEIISPTTNEVKKGIQFFLDTHDDSNTAKYFKFEWEETYEVQAPYGSFYQFIDLEPDPDTAIIRTESVNICYATAKSSAIILGATDRLTENRLSGMDVRFITAETDRLRYAYSLLVRQYVISATAYSFYRELVANNENNGSLFDKQLGAVVGNIQAVDYPDETVLGFFEVSGVSERRAFVKYQELDGRFPWPDTQYPCSADQVVKLTNKRDSMTYYYKGRGYEVIYAQFCDTAAIPPPSPPCPFSSQIDMAPRYCTDCRFRGPAVKPDFWIY